MGCLEDIRTCINKVAQIEGSDRNFLEEKKTGTKIQIVTEGQYLLYDFEKIKQPLFPFFERTETVAGLNAIADKVLITVDKKNVLWILVVELKKNNGNPQNQLYATRQFMNYIIESVNRQCKADYKAELRGLGYSKLIRPTTRPGNIYDINKNAFFSGDVLKVVHYLQHV